MADPPAAADPGAAEAPRRGDVRLCRVRPRARRPPGTPLRRPDPRAQPRRPLRTAPSEEAWADGVRDAQWVTIGGLHTRRGDGRAAGPVGGRPADPAPARHRRRSSASRPPTCRWAAGTPATCSARTSTASSRRCTQPRTGPSATPRSRASSCVGPTVRRATNRPDLGRGRRGLAVAHPAPRPRCRRRGPRGGLQPAPAQPADHAPRSATGPRPSSGSLVSTRARRVVADSRAAGTTLADVATRTGYYDQSHLVRDFREFAGLGPTAWLAAEFPNLQGTSRHDGAPSSA